MKKLSFVEAVKSGKNFRCVETGELFFQKPKDNHLLDDDGCIHTFDPRWLHQEFEIIEAKKELTASEIEEAFFEVASENSYRTWEHIARELTKKLGFK